MGFYDNNFLICPAFEKCGTTSLYAFLQNRAGIVLTREKETFFFNGRFEEGEEAYKGMFLKPSHTNAAPDIWYADITPSYFRQPRTFQRLTKSLSGEVVIVFLIRNPVKRAFSLYWHDMVRHITKGEKEANRFENFVNCSFDRYLGKSKSYIVTPYADVLEKWMAAYPNNVIVHTIEDVIKNPDILISDLNWKTGLSLETELAYPRENEALTATLTINPRGVFRHDPGRSKQIDLDRRHAINAMAMQGTFTHFLPKSRCEEIFETIFADDTKRCEDILDRDLSMFKEQSNLISPIIKSYV